MSSSAAAADSPEAQVGVLRAAWLAAVKAGDAERIAAMVTDDVVIVHGDGRSICGREQLKADFLNVFKTFSIVQKVLNPQITVRDDWAVEIAEVESTLTPIRGVVPIHVVTMTVIALRRQAAGEWKVARVMGMQR
jgi:uncharacterized protein (TIGR02246 family)